MSTLAMPECTRRDCFACDFGKCRILISNDFGKRKCPFFKTREQLAEEEHKRKLREEMLNQSEK